MNELQAQLDAVNAQISEEQAKGPQKDADVLANLEQKQQVILIKIDDAKAQKEQADAQQVRIQAQEEKVESEPIPIAVSGVDLSKLDPDLIQLMEIVTKADRRARLVEFNAEIETLIAQHREDQRASADRELQFKRQNDELQNENQLVTADRDQSKERLQQLSLDLSDAQSKRDAAVREKEEQKQSMMEEIASLQTEISRLGSEIQDYQKAKVFGERQAQKIIDITPEETNKAQNLVDSLVKKFVSTTPIGGNWHEVVDEAGNKMVVHANELQKLEEVQPFRPNTEVDQGNVEPSTPTQAVTVPEIAEVTRPEVQFPVTQQVQAVSAPVVSGPSSTDGQGTETVTRTEFEALKAVVKELCEVCDVNIAEVA